MLPFEDSYFEGETRDDFYIEPMMKRCWAAQMEVLADIDKVCKKHDITYFADWGTLLGAVRHHGFIPWDDDMDICMRREDYMKFLKIAEQELPSHYTVYNMHTNIENVNFLNRVVNTTEIKVDAGFLTKYHGFPYLAGIDIFPVDYFPTDEEEAETLRSIMKFVAATSNAAVDPEITKEELIKMLDTIEELCRVKVDRTLEGPALRNHLVQLIEKLFMMYDRNEAQEMCSALHYFLRDRNYRLPKSDYESVIMMPFETIEIPVPIGYDRILQLKYGADYMTPIRGGGAHGYPYFKEQREQLRDWMRENHIPEEQFEL